MILLDTHAIFWLRTAPNRLPGPASTQIAESAEIAVSDISLWELAMLADRGRIGFAGSLAGFLDDLVAETQLLHITASVASTVLTLGDDFPTGDPADRIIYATSVVHNLPLVSADRRLRAHDPTVIWD